MAGGCWFRYYSQLCPAIRLGQGTGSPYYSWYTQWNQLQSLTQGADQYTVVFQWKTSNSEFINELVNSADASNQITCPEIVKAYADSSGQVSDWHYAVGCGPFMVTGFCWRQFGNSGQESQLLWNGRTPPAESAPLR